jgi:hypothetical protein
MAKRKRAEWQWNRPPSGAPVITPEPIQELTPSERALIGRDLVDISSLLSKLEHVYLSAGQREDLAHSLQERYLHLQQLAIQSVDWEARRKLTHFLVVVGSIGVMTVGRDEAPDGKIFSFLEAMAEGRVTKWVHLFYQGARNVAGEHHVQWDVTHDVLDELTALQCALMRWLEDQATH